MFNLKKLYAASMSQMWSTCMYSYFTLYYETWDSVTLGTEKVDDCVLSEFFKNLFKSLKTF